MERKTLMNFDILHVRMVNPLPGHYYELVINMMMQQRKKQNLNGAIRYVRLFIFIRNSIVQYK